MAASVGMVEVVVEMVRRVVQVVVLEVELVVVVVVLEVKLLVLFVVLEVELVVVFVVIEAHKGPLSHMARVVMMMMMMNVSHGPPTLEEPTLLGSPDSPDLLSSHSWIVPLHVMIL